MGHPSRPVVQRRLVKYLNALLMFHLLLLQIDSIRCRCMLEAESAYGYECGESAFIKTSPRIYGGHRALPGEFPHQVFLQTTLGNFCGGVIIHRHYVLTAAHCVRSPCFKGPTSFYPFRVTAGQLNHVNVSEYYKFDPSAVIVHEGYCSDPAFPLANDIALVRLNRPIHFDLTDTGHGSANRVCMPAPNGEPYKAGDSVTLSGWGLTDFSGRITLDTWSSPNSFPDTLRTAELQLLSNEECDELWEGFVPSSYFRENKLICTRNDHGQATCSGDSGSPLVRNPKPDNRFELVGLASFTSANCSTGTPDVFTRVAAYSEWVRSNMNGLI